MVLTLGAAGALLVTGAALLLLLTASLPRRSGRVEIPALGAPVAIELDAHAIPRIRAASVTDAFRAQGFLHAQERFFQMDLYRRAAAGTLSEIVGARAAARDLEQLPLRFAERAEAVLANLPGNQRSWLEAYGDGVNAGLADLGARPPEYLALGVEPTPWRPADSILVTFALTTMLSTNHSVERPQAVLAATLPPEVYAFLTPSRMRFDAPQRTDAGAAAGGYEPLPIPSAATIDLRDRAPVPLPDGLVAPLLTGAASNQWAVAASRGASGQALLANDPHLNQSLPNLFYRAELYIDGRAIRGASVPGLPGILIGASDDLAWGATVSYGDQSDWVVVEIDPSDPGRYLTPSGSEPFVTRSLPIASDPSMNLLEIRETRWGPVLADDGLGRPLALKATWLDPAGVDLGILNLAFARDVEEALATIAEWSGPALSWAVADTAGNVAWAMNGPLPRRIGFDGAAPVSWADGSRRWQGDQVSPQLRQRELVFNANNRPLDGDAADGLSRVWMRPYRAHRIQTLLSANERFSESDFLAIQLDTDAFAYEPYRAMILEVVAERDPDPALAEARALAAAWNGRADADSAAFALLHSYYVHLLQAVLGPLLEPAAAADPDFVYRWPLADEPLLRLLEERPAHLLAPGYADWPSLLRSALVDTVADIERSGTPLATPWGEVNALAVAHPLAALPLLGRRLSLPATPQPGAAVSVRVAEPARGAVFRLVVAPGDPGAGSFELGGGQSGHFLSRQFKDQQADWATGAPAPFLAGPTAEHFELVPAAR